MRSQPLNRKRPDRKDSSRKCPHREGATQKHVSRNLDQRRILVIKLGALGDVIQALGPMQAIRGHHPHDEITVLTTPPYEELIAKSGYADRIWIDSRPKWYQPHGWLVLRQRLNSAGFDRVYDLQNNDRTGFYLRLFSRPNRPEWVGAAAGASHRNASKGRVSGKAFDGHVQTLSLADIKNVRVDDLSWMTTDLDRFDLRAPYVLIVPGSAPSRPEKRWPAESFAGICRALAQKNYQPVLIGAAADRDAVHAIAAACPAALNLCGRTSLMDVPGLARGAAAALSNDTGPAHMIVPTGCPSLVLFSGCSDPARHAPLMSAENTLVCLQSENIADITVAEVLGRLDASVR